MKAFECKMCGECCYGEGGIVVDEKEAERIARFLKITRDDFLSQFCEYRNDRVYIKTGADHFCIFFHHEKACLIHPVKPSVCSLWPFYTAIVADKETWEMAKDGCSGINPDCSFEDFVKQSKR